MSFTSILLLILIIQLTIFGVIGYIFWKKFGKTLLNTFKMVKNLNNSPFLGKKTLNSDIFEQQMKIINKFFDKNHKK
jgi:hypothetical protein